MESFDDFPRDENESNSLHYREDTNHSTKSSVTLFNEQPLKSHSNSFQKDAPRSPNPSVDKTESRQETRPSIVAEEPLYPQLTHEQVESPRQGTVTGAESEDEGGEIDGLEIPRQGPHRSTPSPEYLHRNRGAVVSSVGDEGVVHMHRFTLYETSIFYYVVGSDMLRQSYRILKINRNADVGELDIIEDDIVYTHKETQQIINAIDEGNKSTGGLKVRSGEFWGILGFVKFTGAYYMLIVSKRSHVAVLGGHYVDKIDQTEMIQLTTATTAKAKVEKYLDETRLVSIFGAVDLSKGFYFSRSYDVTRNLQHNITRERDIISSGADIPIEPNHNDMFVWNHHLLEPIRDKLTRPFEWCLAIIHGYIDQSALSIYWGRVVYITIIARRSRFFAGARYLKRGANDLGYVANDVETEQIVSEMKTQSFHAPGPRLFASPSYTSYVQHRGSIPLYWTQDSSGVQPKPDIHLSVIDPFYSAAALHFDDLFRRYGTPVYALNLIKQKERVPREGKLGSEYKTAIEYLNQFLPDEHRIIYRAFDQGRTAKSKDGDVIGDLERIAEDVLTKTSFFHNGYDNKRGVQLQNGVARTNCIDCIDRTNAAQFMIGKKALGYQLRALGVLEDTHVEFETDATEIFTNMWHDHGDTIAIQYGGSHLVNTMSTYRKMNGWQSHSRDVVENLKRFYNNSFLDAQRQEAYNLFLGTYTYRNGTPMIWDLSSDYYLHHTEPRAMFGRHRPKYTAWYTPEYLEPQRSLPSIDSRELRGRPISYFDDYWSEYYRPLTLSSFRKVFAFKMHSNLTMVDIQHQTQDGCYDLSPFVARNSTPTTAKDRTAVPRKKGVKVIAPTEEQPALAGTSIDARLAATQEPGSNKPQQLDRWLDGHRQNSAMRRKYTGIIKDSAWEKASRNPVVPAMPGPNTQLADVNSRPTKAEQAAITFEQMVFQSLNPKVKESDEYENYIAHPSTIALVTSTDTDYTQVPKEFVEYIARNEEGRVMQYQHAITEMVDGYTDAPYAFMTVDERAESNKDEYQEYIESGQHPEPLSVLAEDDTSKRYKKYRSWLKGKSLFKQKHYVAGELV